MTEQTPMSEEDLIAFSKRNWNRVPKLVRQDCVNHLKAKIPVKLIDIWKQEYKDGVPIGSRTPGFHFNLGMAIRNCLRDQLTDGELPPVVGPDGGYPEGEEVRNWDDFYLGALVALVEQEMQPKPRYRRKRR